MYGTGDANSIFIHVTVILLFVYGHCFYTMDLVSSDNEFPALQIPSFAPNRYNPSSKPRMT